MTISKTAIIHDNVSIGNNSIIGDYCVIGAPGDIAHSDKSYINPYVLIGENAHIRSHSIIYSGNTIGDFFHLGHFSILRSQNTIGNHSSIGNRSEIHGGTKIGDYTRLHSNVDIAYANIGNYVWIFTGAKFTSDPHPPSKIAIGPRIDDFTIIAVDCTILSQVHIGQHCLIGAKSLVTKDIENYCFAFGIPATKVKDIRQLENYPWPANFSKGYPWEDMSFAEWSTL